MRADVHRYILLPQRGTFNMNQTKILKKLSHFNFVKGRLLIVQSIACMTLYNLLDKIATSNDKTSSGAVPLQTR